MRVKTLDREERMADKGRALEALSAEYSALQVGRSSTVFESNGRISVYLSTVSSFVVALAFIGNVSRVGRPFYVFALVLLPALFVLGWVTYARALQSGIEDYLLSLGMARIRRYLSDVDPEARQYFLLSTNDDHVGHLVSMGIDPTRRQLPFTAATMVLAVNSMVLGTFAGLVAASFGWNIEACAVLGTASGLIALAVFVRHESREWGRAETAIEPLFPSPTDHHRIQRRLFVARGR
jgi:hypothetical protein